MIRPTIYAAAVLTAAAAAGVIAARAGRAAMRWAIQGTLEVMHGNR